MSSSKIKTLLSRNLAQLKRAHGELTGFDKIKSRITHLIRQGSGRSRVRWKSRSKCSST